MRKLQVQGVDHITDHHLADAIEELVLETRNSLSDDRSARQTCQVRPLS